MPESGLTLESMRIVYHTRCREIQVRANYPSSFPDIRCPSPGCESRDTQEHLFVSSCFSEINQITTNDTKYEDIFRCDIPAQVRVMEIIFQKIENRRNFAGPSDGGLPEDPRKTAAAPRLGIQKAKHKYKTKRTTPESICMTFNNLNI